MVGRVPKCRWKGGKIQRKYSTNCTSTLCERGCWDGKNNPKNPAQFTPVVLHIRSRYGCAHAVKCKCLHGVGECTEGRSHTHTRAQYATVNLAHRFERPMNTAASEETYTSASLTVEVPFDLIRLSIDEIVLLKCKKGREVRGRLHVRSSTTLLAVHILRCLDCRTYVCIQAYDEHMNAILGDVTERHTYTELDPETQQERTVVRCYCVCVSVWILVAVKFVSS
uniref:U6 snRNA-associated Sm-like protein LSm3 n=1 Tax=Lygus hesperus TaxID=30085 RepID=A0A0A9WJA3_LYGHE